MSLERYVGKVAVVTGASAGIGKAIAVDLVKAGVVVAALARRVERLEELSKQLSGEKGKLHAFKCDVTKEQEIIDVFEQVSSKLGPINILVNNAGLALQTDIIDGDSQKWKTIIDTNVIGLAIAAREGIKSMKHHNVKGHIVNINSVLGHEVADAAGLSVYPASKHAVTALTETLRLEINRGKLPIKITSISPGLVKTEFLETAFGAELSNKILAIRPGLVSEDVADAVHYVLSTPEHVNIKELSLSVVGQSS